MQTITTETGQKPNLLIVDDNPANLRLLVSLLTDSGYKVRPVPSGALALSAAQLLPPDLILLDINMPDMNGYEVCQRLKTESTTKHIPVLFISALDDAMDKVHAFRVGGVDYITKPFQPEEVLARIQTHLHISQLQKQLQHAKEEAEHAKESAETANRAKSRFLANMSHELRTPLNGILGYAQILRHDSNLTPQQQEGINIIQRSGEYLLTLINDILDLSKIEADRMELYPSDFNLGQFINNVVELFRMRAEQKDIRFIYDSPFVRTEKGQLPNAVQGDEKRLRQILINLLSNAIKFTEKGQVVFRVEKEQDEICFSVEDTGIGIPNNKLEDIFLPFQQVGSYNQQMEGTGLGLSISNRLVSMMGGKLQLNSTIGQGSRFWFSIKLPEVKNFLDNTPCITPKIIGYEGKRRKVLIIDDQKFNQMVCKHLLQPLGFEISHAYTGKEGIEKTQELEPDVILMDLVMPEMDGFTTTEHIRQLPIASTITIIAASASAFSQDQQKSLDSGCNDFIAKPIKAEELLRKIQRYLNLQWTYESPQITQQADTQLITPSTEQLKTLQDLTIRGDIEGILEYITILENSDKTLQPFTYRVRQMAKNFQLKHIRELIKSLSQ
ncbi:response regulator [Beggiatoa leptomitoformis]|uniref:histidine kinase n=1 Tax=Beggiatoa leptomitoformis TaxID=288004 RepID=A0A2N9YI06_9GAMM|nr:response regulator [Beggiatoa leptomitoformis]AUI70137.1 response regulator [Beggiatoa leptomitoformis]QGX03631.1 response regulator [Beggiatoa leptomitoformis]